VPPPPSRPNPAGEFSFLFCKPHDKISFSRLPRPEFHRPHNNPFWIFFPGKTSIRLLLAFFLARYPSGPRLSLLLRDQTMIQELLPRVVTCTRFFSLFPKVLFTRSRYRLSTFLFFPRVEAPIFSDCPLLNCRGGGACIPLRFPLPSPPAITPSLFMLLWRLIEASSLSCLLRESLPLQLSSPFPSCLSAGGSLLLAALHFFEV